MKRFITASESLYEIDEANKFIRRLNGFLNPTPRLGADGEWKKFEKILNLIVGKNAIIVWNLEGQIPGTITNIVTHIYNASDN